VEFRLDCQLLRSTLVGILLVATGASAQVASGKDKSNMDGGLRLSAEAAIDDVSPERRLRVTLKNAGGPARVSLGTKWNDTEIIPNLKVSLNRDGKRYQVIYRKEFRWFEGKTELLTVVLQVGGSYTFDLPFKEYIVVLTGAFDPDLEEFAMPGDEILVETAASDDDYHIGRYYVQDCWSQPCWQGSLSTSFKIQ
jgi:hypothetical protein